jgi:energy-coupling factor transporter ATPase
MSILVDHLTHIYNPGTPTAGVALHDVSLRIEEGSCAAIVGVTGSGKSTLVQHFNGLLRPTSGRIEVNGVEVSPHAGKGADLRELRRHVGLLFQFPEAQLFAPTIFDDVAFGPRQLGLDEATVRGRVRHALASVALDGDDAFLARSPFALSGGQRRRVALAGVLAMKPRVLVLDEPSAGLDAEARDELYERLADLRTRDGLTIVLVSHDMGEVARLADTLFILSHGELKLSGSPDDLFRRTGEIAACGLLPPPLAQVAALAGTYGLPLTPPRLTVDDLADSILSLHAAQTLRDGRSSAAGGSHDAE